MGRSSPLAAGAAARSPEIVWARDGWMEHRVPESDVRGSIEEATVG